ncbi:MAG TPA: hypothetical protein VNG53_11705 [Bacteroidia bacterium]|nr:hypothetical protein [Bacteroidia bacterium]
MIKKIIFSLLFIAITTFSFAQTEDIQAKADSIAAATKMTTDSTSNNQVKKTEIYKGTYRGIFMGLGFVVGKSDSAGDAINYGKSTDFMIGYTFKTDLCSFDAIGYDVTYRITSFNLKQNSAKILPNNVQHKSEVMNFNDFELTLFNRFQIGNNAHSLGHYLDIGAYGDWTFSVVHKTVDTYSVANAAGASTTDTKDKGLVFVNPFNYGLMARIGFNRWMIYGDYRLSNQFKSGYVFPELPKITLGVQLHLFGKRKRKESKK